MTDALKRADMMDIPTRLFLAIDELPSGRYRWTLRAENGLHVVVEGGSSYMTEASARQGYRRFRVWYLKHDARIIERWQP
jgi:uncharacterized protein YegP (UPF0339 family)